MAIVLIVQMTELLRSISDIVLRENATLFIYKHYFTYRHVFLAKCAIYLYLLLFLSWYQSDTDMQNAANI